MRRGAALDRAVAAGLCVLLLAHLALTARSFGVTWDEPAYFRAARAYWAWLSHPAFTRAGIDRLWSVNLEHPPLAKLLAGLAFALFSDYRLAAWPFACLLVASLYALGRELFGRAEGALACIFLFLIPRFASHAHIFSLDFMAAAAWTFLALEVWRRRDEAHAPASLAAAAWLALATKVNACLALAARPLMTLARRRSWSAAWPAAADLARVAALALLGLVAAWPWLWPMSVPRLAYFLLFHAAHFTVPTYYLGSTRPAPWHYPYVMLAATTPLLLLAAACAGLTAALRSREERGRGLFLAFNLALPVFLVQLSPARFDGVRLFLPAFPFLALAAGRGLTSVPRPAWRAAAAVLLAGELAWQNHLVYPYLDSYYSEAVGGLRGAQAAGLEASLWCESAAGLVPFLSAHPEARFWAPFCGEPAALDAFMATGGDVRWAASAEQADYWLLVNRRGELDAAQAALLAGPAEAAVERQGVVLAGIYRPPRRVTRISNVWNRP